MGLLSQKSDKQIWAEDEVKKNAAKLIPILGLKGVDNLKKTLTVIAEEDDFEEAKTYLEYTIGRIDYYNNKQKDYLIESNLADKVYKSYVTDGLSRLEKVNGRFLAAQNMKLDVLIEQNTRIIQLLEKIAGETKESNDDFTFKLLNNERKNNSVFDNSNYCPNCNIELDDDSTFCTYCGTKIDRKP